MLSVMLEVAKARKQIDDEVDRTGPKGERPHIRPDQGNVSHFPGPLKQVDRQIDADRPKTAVPKRQRVTAGAAADIEHPVMGQAGEGPLNQGDHALRIGSVPMGIELEVFLTKPFLKPIAHRVRSTCDTVRHGESSRRDTIAPAPRPGPTGAAG